MTKILRSFRKSGKKKGTKRTRKVLIKRIKNIDANKTVVDQCRDYVSSNITKKIVRKGERALLLSSLTNFPRSQIAKKKNTQSHLIY